MAINPFFNANDYLAKNKDLVAAGLHTPEQLWEHYVTYGAQENAEGNANRAPNSWFDVNYYLGNYPDLVNAGITANQALNHYYEYGINEGRSFNPTLLPSQFDAEQYAADNKDVREAFGIEEDAELTAQDEANLLKHFLSYGYAEGREGAGPEFENAVQALNVIEVTDPDEGDLKGEVIDGTIGNDKFIVNDATFDEKSVIDGWGGKNSVVFETETTKGVTLRNIQSVEVGTADDETAVAVTATVAGQLDSLTLTNAGKVNLTFNSAKGAEDALNVAVVKAADLTVNGLETVNLAFDSEFSDGFALNANDSQGATQTINLSGGDKDGIGTFTFDNKGSAKLTDLTIDGSGLAGGLGKVLLVAEGSEAQGIKNVTVKGSADAENNFDIVVGANQLLTVIGGNEDDTFNAGKAIETLTGGRGNDTFVFSSVDVAKATVKDGKVTAVDTITDFKKGDALNLGGVDLTKLTLKTGEDAALKTLEDWVAKADESNSTAFNFEGDGYILVAATFDADDASLDEVSLIKLAGVNVDSFFDKDGATKLNDAGNFIFA